MFKSEFLSEGDPSNYLTYYKRGTVYLALGKAKFALLDLDKVLELKADFTPAKLQRGNILLKQAHFDEAEYDFHDVVCYLPCCVIDYDSFHVTNTSNVLLFLLSSFLLFFSFLFQCFKAFFSFFIKCKGKKNIFQCL